VIEAGGTKHRGYPRKTRWDRIKEDKRFELSSHKAKVRNIRTMRIKAVIQVYMENGQDKRVH